MVDKKIFDFKKQLAYGNKKELEFIEIYPKQLVIADSRKYDFDLKNGKTLELKSDNYDADKTTNFFMERYSDMYKKTPGGIWRAAEDDIDIFIYWFPKNKLYFEFTKLKNLAKVLDKITDGMYVQTVRNASWITAGYKVPRDLLLNHYKRVTYE